MLVMLSRSKRPLLNQTISGSGHVDLLCCLNSVLNFSHYLHELLYKALRARFSCMLSSDIDVITLATAARGNGRCQQPGENRFRLRLASRLALYTSDV